MQRAARARWAPWAAPQCRCGEQGGCAPYLTLPAVRCEQGAGACRAAAGLLLLPCKQPPTLIVPACLQRLAMRPAAARLLPPAGRRYPAPVCFRWVGCLCACVCWRCAAARQCCPGKSGLGTPSVQLIASPSCQPVTPLRGPPAVTDFLRQRVFGLGTAPGPDGRLVALAPPGFFASSGDGPVTAAWRDNVSAAQRHKSRRPVCDG